MQTDLEDLAAGEVHEARLGPARLVDLLAAGDVDRVQLALDLRHPCHTVSDENLSLKFVRCSNSEDMRIV